MRTTFNWAVKSTDTGYDSPTFAQKQVRGIFPDRETAVGHMAWEVNSYMDKNEGRAHGDIYTGGTYDDGVVYVGLTVRDEGPEYGKSYGMKFEIVKLCEPETIELDV